MIQIVAGTAGLAAGLNAAGRMVRGFAGAAAGVVRSVGGAIARIGSRAAGQFVGNLATRGLDLLVEQGQNVLKFEEALVRFGISGRIAGTQLRMIGDAARKTSTAIGVDALEVLNAGRAYIDLAGAENFSIEKMNLLARAAQATGSSTTDLAGMMYQLTRSMHVPDAQLEDTMGGLINQAKDGAIEAKQMAAEFAGILPLFARFGVIGREGTIQAGAMFQVMRDGANSAAEAGTMLQRVYAGVQSYAPRFEKEGIQIYEKFRDKLGRKVLLPFPVIFKNIVGSEAMKDPARVKKMFGRTEGWRGILLGDEASRAFDRMDKSGQTALSRLMALEEAGRENGVIQRDLATYTESSSGKIAMAVEKMKNAVAVAFTPERVAAFADLLTRESESFMEAAHWIDKHVGLSDSDLGSVQQGQIKKEIIGSNTTLDEQKKIAIAMQNYRDGGELPPVATRAIRGARARTGDVSAETIRAVGERLGEEMRSGGAQNTISAGMMVHQDQERAAGAAYLKKLGWSPPGSSGASAQEAIIAEAVRKALEPALRNIARALGTAPPAVLKVDGNPIANASANASDRRRSP